MIQEGQENTLNIHAIQWSLWGATFWMDAGKAIWNRYFQLFLLKAGFNIKEVGVIKSTSLIAKACLQLVIPALEDSGVFTKLFPPGTAAHFLAVFGAMLTVLIVMVLSNFCQPENLQIVIMLKCLLSTLAVFSGLADGISARTVQSAQLKYSSLQSIHAVSWCVAVLVGGFLAELYGLTIIFPLVACCKSVASCCVMSLARMCPLVRTQKGNALVMMKNGVREICGDAILVKLMLSMVVWGSCFIAVETITFIQMDRDFKLSKYASGVSSVISVLGGLPVYHYAPRLIRSLGHDNLIRIGILSACLFLLLHCMLTEHNAMLALPLCLFRGFSYSAIWTACMDIVISRVTNELLITVQSMINLAWFTLGQSVGYALWTFVYSTSGPRTAYCLCAGVLMLSQFSFLGSCAQMTRQYKILCCFMLLCMLPPLQIYFFQSRVLEPKLLSINYLSLRNSTTMIHLSNVTDKEFELRNLHTVQLHHGTKSPSVATMETRHTSTNTLRSPGHRPSVHAEHRSDHLTYQTLALLQNLTTKPDPRKTRSTLHNYVRHRMQFTNPKLYSHFADRRWLNQWIKVRQCNVSVPKMLAFFTPANITALQAYVAPASGAVVKLNHWAGNVKILKPHTTLNLSDWKFYAQAIDKEYPFPLERHYRLVPHGVIIEEFLDAFRGQPPPDYKSYAFDGTVAMVRIDMDRKCSLGQCTASSLHVEPLTFKKLPFHHHHFHTVQREVAKPCGWEDAMQSVKCLSSGINFARIDMYILNCVPYLGEITMTPMGGFEEVFGGGSKMLGDFLSSWDIYPRGIEEGILR
jgi:hypothetical protein